MFAFEVERKTPSGASSGMEGERETLIEVFDRIQDYDESFPNSITNITIIKKLG